MTVKVDVPESEPFRTEGPYCFSVEEIRADRHAGTLDGFTADTCGECRKTANVLTGRGGWHCTCGHFNMLRHGTDQTPHANPDLGPTLAVIDEGFRDPVEPAADEESGSGTCGVCRK